jgi:hypothetical protein
MFIEKEPQKAAEDLKAKKALDKEPPVEAKARKDLKGMGYDEQVKAVQVRKDSARRQPEGPAAPSDPVTDLRKLFTENNLCERLVPGNVETFTYDPASGALFVQLKEAFSKRFDAENTVSFAKTISGTLKAGSFSGLSGITRGSATIVSISRLQNGSIGIRGKLGPFAKTIEFRDEQIPSLP